MDTTPLLPLDRWREIMGFHPWHFWGLTNATTPLSSACNGLVTEYSWQAVDAAGRNEIRAAILTAEARLREHLGFSPAPHYVEETLSIPDYYDSGSYRLTNAGADGRWATIQLGEGYVQAVGVESRTLIGSANVAYSDADGDGLDETFTATIATAQTDPAKIAVYFAAANRLDGEAVSERWRIQPVSVSISSGIATIKGRSWLLVKPLLYEGVATDGLDPDTASNFVTAVEVYTRTTDPAGTTTATSQAMLIWETAPWPGWACCGSGDGFGSSSLDPAALAYAVARAGIRDSRLGLVAPAQAGYNATDGVWAVSSWSLCRPPDRVTVRYYAGYPLTDGQMNRDWQTIVARLAAAELNTRICACNDAHRELFRWQFDPSNGEDASISLNDLDNPLGTRYGHIYAWRRIRDLRIMRGSAY